MAVKRHVPVVRKGVAHEVTPARKAMVMKLAGLQVTQREAAMVMEISEDTIQRHYAKEWERGRAKQGANLREHAYTLAYGKLKNPDKPEDGYVMPPDVRMTQFLLERQHGMIERREDHHSFGELSPEAAAWLGKSTS